jgi:hypothetical protein
MWIGEVGHSKEFQIAPHFYPICFDKCWTIKMGQWKGTLGFKIGPSILGASIVSFFYEWWVKKCSFHLAPYFWGMFTRCYYGPQVNIFRSSGNISYLNWIVGCSWVQFLDFVGNCRFMHFTKNHNQRIACSSMWKHRLTIHSNKNNNNCILLICC